MSCRLWLVLVLIGILPDPPTAGTSQPTPLLGEVVDGDTGHYSLTRP
jgi:hypothetical protein